MRILIDGRLYGLENSGIGRYLINLVEGLVESDKTNNYILLLRQKYFDELKLPANWKKVAADFRHYGFEEQVKLPRIIAREKPDVTHFPHFNVPVFFNGNYIVTIHDMLMHKSRGLEATTLPAPQYFIKRLGYKTVFFHAVKKASLVIVPSLAVKKELEKAYAIPGDKIRVTYEGVDKKILSSTSQIKMPKPYFIYVGNAYPHKNLLNLIKAIKLLNTKTNQKVFLAISSARNIFTQKLEKLITETDSKNFVKLLGFVEDSALGNLYKESVAFVFPSFSEGFGLPGLEALASGTLLLASNIDVFKEVYGRNAFYFDPNSPESIAECMGKSLMLTGNERNKIIKLSSEFVKRYSWNKMARETLKIYEESCNSLRQS